MLLNHNLRIRAENMNKFMNKYDDIKKLIPTRTIELKPILITPFQVYKEESNQQETKKIILQPHTHVEEDEIIETPQIKEPIDYQPIHESIDNPIIDESKDDPIIDEPIIDDPIIDDPIIDDPIIDDHIIDDPIIDESIDESKQVTDKPNLVSDEDKHEYNLIPSTVSNNGLDFETQSQEKLKAIHKKTGGDIIFDNISSQPSQSGGENVKNVSISFF